MENLAVVADRLNRTVKIALDTGEASSIEDAERIFSKYRMQIVVGGDVAHSLVLQAALLTAVNCASRTFLGGVTVVGATGGLCVTLRPFTDLQDAVVQLGGKILEREDDTVPTVVIGDVEALVEPLAIRTTFSEWCGGVIPMGRRLRLAERGDFTPAGVLAGALAVSEIFQRVRGNPFACRRSAGLDLWRPMRDWLRGEGAGKLDRLPSSAWLLGLGNLGQSYLWVLGLLPYGNEGTAELVLQDFDVLTTANLSTSLLTTPALVGMRKTRAMAQWADMRGFRTSIIERNFATNFQVAAHEPPVVLAGVDNALARQGLESVGFARVIEAGLGRGPQDFMGIDVHTFPASAPACQLWRDAEVTETDIAAPAYATLLTSSQDRCGTVRLAGRSIGAPFVGATAATLVIAELLRLTLGGERHEVISCHLRDLTGRTVIPGQPWSVFNTGGIRRAA